MFSIELEEDCWVFVDKASDGVRLVNEVAAFIGILSSQGLEEPSIVARLVERYDVAWETASRDVAALLHSFRDDASLVSKGPDSYQPITDFKPYRECRAVETCECYLPGFTIHFASELSGVTQCLQELFPLPEVVGEQQKELFIDVFTEGDRFPVVFEGSTLDTGLELTDTALKCLREVNGIIGREEPYSIIFHASAVARDGKAVLFPALGGSGKTTLAAYLMAHDFELINDDTVPLNSKNALLQPIPLSLSIKQGSWSILDAWYPSLKNSRIYGAVGQQLRYLGPLPESVCREAAECVMVVLPNYCPVPTDLRCEKVSTREAFEHIFQSGCILDQPCDPEQILALVNWLKPLPVYRVTYHELKDVERWLSAQLATESDRAVI